MITLHPPGRLKKVEQKIVTRHALIYTSDNLRTGLVLRHTRLIFLLLFSTFIPTSLMSAPSNAPKKSNIELIKSEFFVFDKITSKRKPSNLIVFSKHNSYGWQIDFKASKGRHVVKEIVKLPAPASWGVGVSTVVSANQMSATTQIPVQSETTTFSAQNVWSYAPGDPTGIYTFEIYVDDALVQTYVINVTH